MCHESPRQKEMTLEAVVAVNHWRSLGKSNYIRIAFELESDYNRITIELHSN